MLMAYEDKSAYAMCIFSFAIGPDVEPITFVGKTLLCFILFILLLTYGSIESVICICLWMFFCCHAF
ncbi:putative nucleotide diphosphatase [Helianthus annuus]|uniref:Nucleotide diphosphatase n=1 Tax=Helianthus annuus TaxID=4232 RepID=A0A9K3HRP6_HELAN|nr:putative nucleotide diphosphatase [Helianthus annuus]